MKMDLRNMLISKIRALYDIEMEIVKALPKMAKASEDLELEKTFLDHLSETKNQVARLEQIFSLLGEKPKKLKVEGIRGIIKDGQWVIKNIEPEIACDAHLAKAAQYVEHYEMAGYMGAMAWAETLGEGDIVTLLETTLNEERMADEKLVQIGEMLDKKAAEISTAMS